MSNLVRNPENENYYLIKPFNESFINFAYELNYNPNPIFDPNISIDFNEDLEFKDLEIISGIRTHEENCVDCQEGIICALYAPITDELVLKLGLLIE